MKKIALSLLDASVAASPLASALYGGGQWSLFIFTILIAKLRFMKILH
jgi:hypothetical protein